jgi:hypothetical protein
VKDLRGVAVAGDPVRGEERKLQEMLLGEEEEEEEYSSGGFEDS